MNKNLIEYFGVALTDNSNGETKQDVKEINKLAAKLGYIIHPDCCTKSVKRFLNDKDINFNSTFYKTFEDVISKSRWDLFVDQIISYAGTYLAGVNITANDGDYSLVPEIRKYKVILPITEEELYDKCMNMLISGVSLKSNTVDDLCDYILWFLDVNKKVDWFKENEFIDVIKNKEAQIRLCGFLNITPNDKFALIRYIYFKVTGETMIVKDKLILDNMKHWMQYRPFDMTKLSEKQLKGLASIFYRYKPLFLGLKKYPNNTYVINRLRRMAKALHKPMEIGFWENILSRTDFNVAQVKDMIKKTNPSNFKLIQLIQTINDRQMLVGGMGDNIYLIRNGKMWVESSNPVLALDPKYEWWMLLKEILYAELVERLKSKACNVKFPTDLKLVCPTSEKNFIGNIPFGSSYQMTEHNMIGIYWRSGWGTDDFDLSFNTFEGHKIGWNSSYYNSNNSLIYSGDITMATPEASEVLYAKKNCPDGVVKVNRFNGREGSKFVLSLAQNDIQSSLLPRNYIIDPNTIKCQTEVISDSVEKMVGFVVDNKFYICDIRTGDSRVSCSGKTINWKDTLKRKGESYLDLKQLLLDAGFKERKRATKDNPIELDLTNLKKDTLIELFS